MTKSKGGICLGMPFVERTTGKLSENGWCTAVFQTDHSQDQFQSVMDVMKTKVTWAKSGLGSHSTAMFFDERPSTQQLRDCFCKL